MTSSGVGVFSCPLYYACARVRARRVRSLARQAGYGPRRCPQYRRRALSGGGEPRWQACRSCPPHRCPSSHVNASHAKALQGVAGTPTLPRLMQVVLLPRARPHAPPVEPPTRTRRPPPRRRRGDPIHAPIKSCVVSLPGSGARLSPEVVPLPVTASPCVHNPGPVYGRTSSRACPAQAGRHPLCVPLVRHEH